MEKISQIAIEKLNKMIETALTTNNVSGLIDLTALQQFLFDQEFTITNRRNEL